MEDIIRAQLGQLALDVGSAVVQRINSLSPHQRMAKSAALLKPPPEASSLPDVEGERVAIELLERAAQQLGHRFCIVGDPSRPHHHVQVGPCTARPSPGVGGLPASAQIWCYLDAVDGTLKLSGLGNTSSCLRAVNDGSWAVGIAFTDPTDLSMEELTLGDCTCWRPPPPWRSISACIQRALPAIGLNGGAGHPSWCPRAARACESGASSPRCDVTI
jgi:hypothetical protein